MRYLSFYDGLFHVARIRVCCGRCQNFLPFGGWIMFHCIMYRSLPIYSSFDEQEVIYWILKTSVGGSGVCILLQYEDLHRHLHQCLYLELRRPGQEGFGGLCQTPVCVYGARAQAWHSAWGPVGNSLPVGSKSEPGPARQWSSLYLHRTWMESVAWLWSRKLKYATDELISNTETDAPIRRQT